MNWTAIIGGIAVLIQILGFAWLGGSENRRGRDNSLRLDQQGASLEDHRTRLDGHDVRLERIDAWRDGYNAGRGKVHSNG